MLLAGIDPLAAFGSLAGSVAAVIGAYALLQARRTEDKTATREEVGQAFDLQDKAMQHIVEENDRLRVRDKDLHDRVNTMAGKLGEMTTKHRQCEATLEDLTSRLRIAESKIAELGG